MGNFGLASKLMRDFLIQNKTNIYTIFLLHGTELDCVVKLKKIIASKHNELVPKWILTASYICQFLVVQRRGRVGRFQIWFCNLSMVDLILKQIFYTLLYKNLESLDKILITLTLLRSYNWEVEYGKKKLFPQIHSKQETAQTVIRLFHLIHIGWYWLNLSRRGGKAKVFQGLAGLLRGISRWQSPREIPRSSSASPRKT